MDSNKAENLSISSTKDLIIWSELATKTNLKSNFEVFLYVVFYIIFHIAYRNMKYNGINHC